MGIPQGIILSVRLFSIKIQVEKSNSDIHGILFEFGDDFEKNMSTIEQQLQISLNRILDV